MRRRIQLVLAGAALAALAVPAIAFAQRAPTLQEDAASGFPDRAYLLQLPSPRTLTTSQLTVTENGGPVVGLGVEPPGGGVSGAILLIDASNSMKGAPIAGAMNAARAFLGERTKELPVAIVAFNPGQTELVGFTTDGTQLANAVANAPALGEGTEIYDTLIEAAEMATDQGLARASVVLLSDGTDIGSEGGRAEALAALDDANVRVISVGLSSPQYDPVTLRSLAQRTGGTYVETATPGELEPIFEQIGNRLSSEYLVTYRSLLPPSVEANVSVQVAGLAPATASYATPALDLTARGSFERNWLDDVIVSPYLMVFIIVAVLALLAFATMAALDLRSRSVRRRMAQYVNVPTEEDSRLRRAEVTAMLAERAQRKVEGFRWWQTFERDVELAGLKQSPVTIAGWTVIGSVLGSILAALVLQSLLGLFVGLLAPFVTRFVVRKRVARKRAAFAEELPDNLEVLAGALRAGHSLIGAMGVMVDGSTEPSRTEFRRVLQDEQLGVPLDDALSVMARRMDNLDVDQVALVTRLGREAGGNTAEVLDRVVDNIRGRMELQRLVRVLTAQGRIARYILTAIPVVLLLFFFWVNPEWLSPLWDTNPGRFALGMWVIMLIGGWFAIKKIVDIEV
ncbi:MAG: type II secretion system F family protein [Gaiellaceae bacterium]